MLLRIMYVITISHIGYIGIMIAIIWNFNQTLIELMQMYNLYSNFICISAVLNSKIEKIISGFIVVLACLVSYCCMAYFLGKHDFNRGIIQYIFNKGFV